MGDCQFFRSVLYYMIVCCCFARLRSFTLKISYNKLWKLLIDKRMKKYQLREMAGISSNSMAKLGKNENVSLDILMKICSALHCNIDDVCEFVEEEE